DLTHIKCGHDSGHLADMVRVGMCANQEIDLGHPNRRYVRHDIIALVITCINEHREIRPLEYGCITLPNIDEVHDKLSEYLGCFHWRCRRTRGFLLCCNRWIGLR